MLDGWLECWLVLGSRNHVSCSTLSGGLVSHGAPHRVALSAKQVRTSARDLPLSLSAMLFVLCRGRDPPCPNPSPRPLRTGRCLHHEQPGSLLRHREKLLWRRTSVRWPPASTTTSSPPCYPVDSNLMYPGAQIPSRCFRAPPRSVCGTSRNTAGMRIMLVSSMHIVQMVRLSETMNDTASEWNST